MRQHHLAASLFAIAAIFCGCSEDSNGSNETQQQAGCTSNEDCQSGKCMESGKCASVVDLGAACDDEHICKTPLVCENGICAEESVDNPPVSEEKCASSLDCKDEKVCKNSKCVDVVTHGRDEACDLDDESVVCQEGLVCMNKKCMTQEDIQNMAQCQSDDDCANVETYVNCLPDGVCGLYLDKGDDCTSDPKTLCKDDMSCIGVCIQEVSEGERCALEEGTDCGRDLNCINEICRKVDNSVEVGKTCNDEWLSCAEPAVCRDGVCASVAKEDEACNEEAHIVCDEGLLCLNSVCTPVGKTCKSTKDCLEKDSFCCLDESCGAKGSCIPYDDQNTHDETCRYMTKPGIFEAQIQCRWQPPSDAYPDSNKVEMPPLVGHFGNKEGLDTVVAFFSYANRNAWEDTYPKDAFHSAIRFINPETCETLETAGYNTLMYQGNNMPAAADLDGDGLMEFITNTSKWTLAAYEWDKEKKQHKIKWETEEITKAGSFLSVFDVDNDGKPEIVWGTSVVNGQTGEIIYNGKSNSGYNGAIGILDLNSDGLAVLAIKNQVLRWNVAGKKWDVLATLPQANTYMAYADFGTPGESAEKFDFKTLDGMPEIVAGSGGKTLVYALVPKGDGTYSVQTIMSVQLPNSIMTNKGGLGGPLTVGDFDNDGLPEVGVASSGFFGVYDPQCTGYVKDVCADKNVLWERWSQDESSGVTGSSLFDFDGDGQTEAVYADECFTRVYDGKTGKVLFSAKRSSYTSFEAPIVADVDGDGSSEILMGSDYDGACYDDNKNKVSPSNPGTSDCVDPIHEGIRCQDDEDCPTGKNCNKTVGLCTCTSDDECNTQFIQGTNTILAQYVCAAPIHPQIGMMENRDGNGRKPVKDIGTRPDNWQTTDYKVCRATRKTKDIGVSDLMIFKDRLDRWVSSRPMWNQHAYNIINIQDNGKVPTRLEWIANWMAKLAGVAIAGTTNDRPRYNNYRMNRQGEYGAGYVPDITGRFIAGSICGTTEDGRHVISGKLCNRGTKPVSTNLPATFFYYNDANPEDHSKPICTSYTKTPVGVGECAQVGCEVSEAVLKELEGKKVLMVSNLDEHGFASTVECNSDNNTDVITVESCESKEIVIVN